MIYITGDCHADFHRFSSHIFKAQKDMTKEDFVIICGDFGGVWYDREEERYWLDWLDKKPFTTLFVCGNHENFDRLYNEFPIVDFHGGKAHQIRESVFHLMRGNIFELCGKKFFAFGGASSHDISDGIIDPDDFENDDEFNKTYTLWYKQRKMFRVKGFSWWEQELPTQEEMDFGIKTLEENDYKVDFVITHCLPQSVASLFSNGLYKADKLTMYFNQLLDNGLQFQDWYCGHYHTFQDYMSKFHIRYETIERIV